MIKENRLQTTNGNGSILSVLQGDAFKKQVALALPKHMTPDRMLRIVLTELRKVPDLMNCTKESLFGAIIQCSQLGLEPGDNLGHAYLLPYGTECNLIIGYKGLIALARRSGQIISISAREVRANDSFHLAYGLEEKLEHIPSYEKDRGELIGFYAIAKLKDGGHQFEYMTRDEINKIKATSKSANRKMSPWNSHYEEMAKKGLALDTKIPTPNGWTTMEKLEIGDEVFDIDGRPTEVIAVSEVKHLPCFKVNFSNEESIICDDEHKWVARCGNGNAHRLDYSVQTVNELYDALQDGKSVTIPMQGKLELEKKQLSIDPWLLGYWLGDGASYHARISCDKKDLDFVISEIEKTKYEIGTIREDPRSNSCDIGIINGFLDDLKSLNLIKNKHIPSNYLRGSIEQRRALLQGLMDSDGHIDKPRGRAHFYNNNINLSNGVAEIVYSLGDCVHRSTKRQFGFNAYCISHAVFWKPSCCPVRNPRKILNYKPRRINAYRSIKSIEQIQSVPTKCIAVSSPTKTYLAGESMAPTHNTVIRRLFKYLPVSVEIQHAVTLDEQADAGVQKNYFDIQTEEVEDIKVMSNIPEAVEE